MEAINLARSSFLCIFCCSASDTPQESALNCNTFRLQTLSVARQFLSSGLDVFGEYSLGLFLVVVPIIFLPARLHFCCRVFSKICSKSTCFSSAPLVTFNGHSGTRVQDASYPPNFNVSITKRANNVI
jgi:hypothetical protein